MALVVLVLLLHGWVAEQLAQRMAEHGSALAMPARMEVVYVREMESAPAPVAALAAPVLPQPAAPPIRVAEAASAPERAASQVARKTARVVPAARSPKPPPAALPEAAIEAAPALTPEPAVPTEPMAAASAPAPEPAPEPAIVAPAAPETVASTAAAPAPAPEAIAAATAASSIPGDGSAPVFEWPASTRVSYRLTGNVRGEVHGDAQVEWLRIGNRYQVHLDVTVGLKIAPLMTRRMSSDGEITPQGLSPRRYDQATKVGFGERQRVAVLFEPDAVVLANGQRRERWPGMQDTASQFIQLIYLFATQPELLRNGASVEVPLALPRNTSRWIYDVLDEEEVYTPIGPISAYHLRPRRAVAKGGDLSAEIWFAPRFRYLPVRIRIQQDAETFIDLVMERRPQLAAQ